AWWCSGPARRSGPSCMGRLVVGWAAARALWCWIIYARACSRPTSTIPRSIPCTAIYSSTTAPCPYLAALACGSKGEGGVRLRSRPERTPLKVLRFKSLEEAQTYLDHWEARWADTRIHRTTKRQVAVMFAEERPFLLPPVEPFRYYQ